MLSRYSGCGKLVKYCQSLLSHYPLGSIAVTTECLKHDVIDMHEVGVGMGADVKCIMVCLKVSLSSG